MNIAKDDSRMTQSRICLGVLFLIGAPNFLGIIMPSKCPKGMDFAEDTYTQSVALSYSVQ